MAWSVWLRPIWRLTSRPASPAIPNRGIEVRQEGGHIVIDIYVIIEYGTRIASVANSLINGVRYTVEQSIGVPVGQINVHVQGLRVSRDK